MRYYHNIPPVFDEQSAGLILGSFPSVKSRAANFYYSHPQNRFWQVLSAVFNNSLPQTQDEKRMLLLSNRIALWDVIGSCEIERSDDSSITGVIPNDLRALIVASNIKYIFANGNTSYNLYIKFCREQTNIEAVKLPSTSPANARFKLDRLISEWSVISHIV